MRWLTENIATAAYTEAIKDEFPAGTVLVDVRDLVDKIGNSQTLIRQRVESVVEVLRSGQSVVICCDYGMSRSNAIAIGAISKWQGIPFSDAIAIATAKVDAGGIKVEVLTAVEAAVTGPSFCSDRNGSKTLVTGSSGALGTMLLNKFGGAGDYVPASRRDFDLSNNCLALDRLVKARSVTSLLHLANPRVYTNVNALGETLVMLKNVLDVCRGNELRITFLSSWEVYSGYRCDSLLADSNLPQNPKGTYGETKWLCEKLVRQYASNYGLKYQIIRFPPIYGELNNRPRFLFNFLEKAISGQKIVTHRYFNGSPRLGMLHIDDAVRLLHAALGSDFLGEINVGPSTLASTQEIAHKICHIIGSASEVTETLVQSYWPNVLLDSSLALDRFGWSADVVLDEGLKRVVHAFHSANS